MLLTPRLLSPKFTKIITTLFITLLVSACSTEDFLAAAAPDIGSGGIANTKTNHPAVVNGADTGSVIKNIDPDGDNYLTVSGKLNITDVDAGEAAFITTLVNGNYGELSIDISGNWRYKASNELAAIQNLTSDTTLTENLAVSSIDGTTCIIIITIKGSNEASGTFTINLSWVPPSEREDNSSISLSEIAGYNIYYGSSLGLYPNKVTINDGSAVGYTFLDFPAGRHYFVVTTIDTEGRESQNSSVTSLVI